MILKIARRVYYSLRRRYWLTRLALSRGPVKADLGWIKLELSDAQDEQMLRYILEAQFFRKADEPIFRNLIYPGDVIIDIGANVGFVAMEMAHYTGTEGFILALEPLKSTFSLLLRTLELNCPTPIKALNIGCSSSAGEQEMYAAGKLSGLNTLSRPSDAFPARSQGKVKLDTLDSIIQPYHFKKIDLIKIDVEGHEPKVLKGAAETLKKYRPKVLFEVSDNYSSQTLDSFNFLESLNYKIDIDREALKDIKSNYDVLAIPVDI